MIFDHQNSKLYLLFLTFYGEKWKNRGYAWIYLSVNRKLKVWRLAKKCSSKFLPAKEWRIVLMKQNIVIESETRNCGLNKNWCKKTYGEKSSTSPKFLRMSNKALSRINWC